MVFRKSYGKTYPRRYRKKFTRKPQEWYQKKYSIGDMAMQALKGVNYIKGLVNAEVYKFDYVNSFSPVTTGGVIDISAIAQGDGITTRTGNSLFVRSIDINGTIAWNSAATGVGQVVKIWLIIDTQQVSDTLPTFSDIFDSNNVNSHLNANTVGRYKILTSQTHIVSSNMPKKVYKIRKEMRHHVRFNGTASTDSQKGTIYYVVCTDVAANLPTVTLESRCSYHDN